MLSGPACTVQARPCGAHAQPVWYSICVCCVAGCLCLARTESQLYFWSAFNGFSDYAAGIKELQKEVGLTEARACKCAGMFSSCAGAFPPLPTLSHVYQHQHMHTKVLTVVFVPGLQRDCG
jgi:hypothetical protein